MNNIKKIHFVGIKGVGMTPLAIIAKEAGIVVSGSDVDKVFITDSALAQAGITDIFNHFSEENLEDVDMVITTTAHNGLQNPEVVKAVRKNIPVLTQAQAVGEFMKGVILGRKFIGICVTGTHGKTTTTSMAATLFQSEQLDPSYLIGTSTVSSLENGLPGHLGSGEYFIAEADEYVGEYDDNGTRKMKTKFLWQYPKYLIMTSLEHDHPDVYESLEIVEQNFLTFAKQLPENGVLIYNGDDDRLRALAEKVSSKKITYGFNENNNYQIDEKTLREDEGGISFQILAEKEPNKIEFSLRVPGRHNALNALAVICLGHEVSLTLETIQQGLAKFRGSKRRLEKVIPGNNRFPQKFKYYDDYAHHPTEIKATLHTLRSIYPQNHIVCIFQPHTYSRTKAFYNDFIHAFSGADELILIDIFASARELVDLSVSSEMLADSIAQAGGPVKYIPVPKDVVEYILTRNYPANTIIVTMGAGDVYSILA